MKFAIIKEFFFVAIGATCYINILISGFEEACDPVEGALIALVVSVMLYLIHRGIVAVNTLASPKKTAKPLDKQMKS